MVVPLITEELKITDNKYWAVSSIVLKERAFYGKIMQLEYVKK